MTKEEMIEFLKENLRVEISYQQSCWDHPQLITKLFLGDEEISKSTEYIYD